MLPLVFALLLLPPIPWSEAIDDIARHPLYGGLKIEPIEHLLPIGKDPVSRLWEFYDERTGREPRPLGARLDVTMEVGIVFVLLPAGSFWMGAQPEYEEGKNYDPDAWPNEWPVLRADVDAFLISKYELSRAQWTRMGGVDNTRFRRGGEFTPVTTLTWSDARAVLSPFGMSLPLEVQWEYACRAGTETPRWIETDDAEVMNAAVRSFRACELDGCFGTGKIASGRPNPWGLYNVLGSVAELCANPCAPYEDGDLAELIEIEQQTPDESAAVRGGSAWDHFVDCRASRRRSYKFEPYLNPDVGVRPVINLPRAASAEPESGG